MDIALPKIEIQIAKDTSDSVKVGQNLTEGSKSGAKMTQATASQIYVTNSINEALIRHKEEPQKNTKFDIAQHMNNAELVAEGMDAGPIIASSHQMQTQAQNTQLYNYNPISLFIAPGKQPPAELAQSVKLAFKSNKTEGEHKYNPLFDERGEGEGLEALV